MDTTTPKDPEKTEKTLKIAVVGLAIVLVLSLGALFMVNSNLSSTQDQVAQLQSQLAAAQQADSADQTQITKLTEEEKKKIAAAQMSIAKLKKNVNKEVRDYKAEKKALMEAHSQYKAAQAAAAADQANLKKKMTVEAHKAHLATECARSAYSGLELAYKDYNTESLTDLVNWIDQANIYCKEVLSTTINPVKTP